MNAQRENFKAKVAEHIKAGAGDHNMKESGEGKTEHPSPVIGESKVMHHEDGSHTVEHHDGEKTSHPSASHMAVHMAAKHDGGEHGHIMAHGGGATTHHVGMDGEPQGPDEHESFQAGAEHLNNAIGDGASPEGAEMGTANMGEGTEDSSFA